MRDVWISAAATIFVGVLGLFVRKSIVTKKKQIVKQKVNGNKNITIGIQNNITNTEKVDEDD